VVYQANQIEVFSPPVPTGGPQVSNPTGYTQIPGLALTIDVPKDSIVLISTHGDVSNTFVGATAITARVDAGIFIDGRFSFPGQPPRSMTMPPNGITPYAMTLAAILSQGSHTISVRGQNYATNGGTFGASGTPGLLTVTILKQ
jgi:hypothetical protein